MKKSLRLTVASVAVALMVGGLGVTAANATTVRPPEGGTWNYGVRAGGIYGTKGQVYSEYNVGRQHKSSSFGAGANYSGWKAAWVPAVANGEAAWSGNTAYYDAR